MSIDDASALIGAEEARRTLPDRSSFLVSSNISGRHAVA